MMQANELASLRSDISELKLQRQELRQLNAYRAAEAANAKDQAMGAQARANQLMRVVEELRTNEAKLQEEANRAGEEIARLKKDLEDERKTKQEALGEKDSEIIGLKAKLRRAEAEAAESRKKCKELEAKVKAEESELSDSSEGYGRTLKRRANCSGSQSGSSKKLKS